MKIEREILPPTMPNFIRFKQEPGRRQDGIKEGEVIDIADLTHQQAEEFADMMRRQFMEHYQQRKELKSKHNG